MKVVLHLTQQCNLRCTYCYAAKHAYGAMDPRIARKGIDLALKLGKKSACISYFGGEPLLRFDLIRELQDYAEREGAKAGLNMHFRLSTNGTLLTEEILRYLRDHRIVIAISLDGTQVVQDRQRPMIGGGSSFSRIDPMLETLLELFPRTIFVTIITPESAGLLPACADYMWSRGIRRSLWQVQLDNPDWNNENFELLRKSYEDLAQWYVGSLRREANFYFSLFDDYIHTYINGGVRPGQCCTFGREKISVAPDGRVFPCVQFVSDKPEAQDFCIGHVDTGMNARWKELIDANAEPRPACRGCDLLGRCRNWCGCLNWGATGNVTGISPFLCAHERMLIPIVDSTANRLWSQKSAAFLKKHYKVIAEDLSEYDVD